MLVCVLLMMGKKLVEMSFVLFESVAVLFVLFAVAFLRQTCCRVAAQICLVLISALSSRFREGCQTRHYKQPSNSEASCQRLWELDVFMKSVVVWIVLLLVHNLYGPDYDFAGATCALY